MLLSPSPVFPPSIASLLQVTTEIFVETLPPSHVTFQSTVHSVTSVPSCLHCGPPPTIHIDDLFRSFWPLSTHVEYCLCASLLLFAHQELLVASHQASWGFTASISSKWKPRCLVAPASDCLTSEQAKNVVLMNYAVASIYSTTSNQDVTESGQAIDLVTLAGMLGGNLGLCIGASIMTWLEWAEMLIFAFFSIPFFYCRVRLPFLRYSEDDPIDGADVIDADIAHVLKDFRGWPTIWLTHSRTHILFACKYRDDCVSDFMWS